MWFIELCKRGWGGSAKRRGRMTPPSRRTARLHLEQLEDRTVPANFTAATVADLIGDINTANRTAAADTITLVAGKTFTLAGVDNYTNGPTGLPSITAIGNLTIVGNGDIIERSTAAGTANFRLFDVAAGASLTLENLTLQGGYFLPTGVSDQPFDAHGGAIDNLGALTLHSVIVQNNTADAYAAVPAFLNSWTGMARGGGIYSSGTLVMDGCIVQNNLAVGGRGNNAFTYIWGSPVAAGKGGNGLGGGLYIAGGTATITNSTFSANTAQGGDGGDGQSNIVAKGGNGGDGFGGGIYLAGGTISLQGVSVTANHAKGGAGGMGAKSRLDGKLGSGIGGGIYIDNAFASAFLDVFTVGHTKRNRASTSNNDIFGDFTQV